MKSADDYRMQNIVGAGFKPAILCHVTRQGRV